MPSTSPHAVRATRPRTRSVEGLSRRLPRVGLAGVLADLDRTGTPTPVPGDAAGDGFTWDPADRADASWWPQGVACAGAAPGASPGGGAGGDPAGVLLVSWYAKRQRGRTQGSRITVVDRRDTGRPRYGHVLLVAPRRRPLLSVGAVPVHAGGIAVLGDLLYVADTLAGVRVFRLSDVLRVPHRRLDAALPWAGAGTRTLGRRPTGGFTAYGYDHVLPQSLALRVPPVRGTARLRCSFLSVGDVGGQLSLVAGEYRRAGTGSARLVRYPLDPATGLPAFGDDGRCPPVELHEHQPPRMQGVAVDGSTWYLSASAGDGPGDLHVGAPGAFRRHRGVLPTGPEDLDWSRPGQELWCATEHPGRRWVFPVDVPRWQDGQG